jgi:hypothetical protein
LDSEADVFKFEHGRIGCIGCSTKLINKSRGKMREENLWNYRVELVFLYVETRT